MANFTPQQIEEFLQEFFDVVGARQYIGARYVPIFGRAGSDAVEWDDLAPYEPLTVVMHDGVSYVSRRYVPAGVEITDTDYWVQTYRFNAQVEQYRQQVLAMQDDVDNRIPFPDPLLYPRFGELGQVLSTLADGTTKWEDPVVPSDEQAEEVITAWLADHPEATTTVQDGSLTWAKFGTALQNKVFKFVAQVSFNNYTALPTFGAALPNSLYIVTMSEAVHQTDYPTQMGYPSGVLITYTSDTQGVRYQEFLDWQQFKYARRRYTNNAWSSWAVRDLKQIDNGVVTYDKLNTALQDKLFKYVGQVSFNNYSLLPTFGDALPNSLYIVTMSAEVHQSDYPTGISYPSGLLITYTNDTQGVKYQEFLDWINYRTARRRYTNSTWSAWSYATDPSAIQRYMQQVNYNNYQSVLPTFADAPINTTYTVSMSDATHQTDYPERFGYPTGLLTTVGESVYKVQTFENPMTQDIAVRRFVNDAWSNWAYYFNSTVIVNANDILIDKLEEAYTRGNCKVYVNAGTYDIAQEYMDRYGSDYFDSEIFTDAGPLLGKGCEYYFETGVNVRCVLPVTASAAAQNYFSPFNAGDGDYTVVGLNLYSEFCRYCIHDEMRGVGDYHHVYKDCNLHHNDTGAGYGQCIGGGLGRYGLIDIEGCIFESDTLVPANSCVSWHNGGNSGVRSRINIHNCYFKTGTVRFSWYGTSTEISVMTVSNCSLPYEPFTSAETQESTVENVSMLKWNNEIRQS